jgi:hypothetical protein
VLTAELPASTRAAHWPAAWLGLDGMEALGLLVTGLLVVRRDSRSCLTAAATGALLLVDAWFDVTTAAAGADQSAAIAMALAAELPGCALCGVLAVHGLRRLTASAEQDAPRAPGSRLASDRPRPAGLAVARGAGRLGAGQDHAAIAQLCATCRQAGLRELTLLYKSRNARRMRRTAASSPGVTAPRR